MEERGHRTVPAAAPARSQSDRCRPAPDRTETTETEVLAPALAGPAGRFTVDWEMAPAPGERP